MKSQFKISYFNAQGLKDSFYEFHPTERFDTCILGGYMKDVTKVMVEATGLTTDTIEEARMEHCPHILNVIMGNKASHAITQGQLDMLGLGEFKSNGIHYKVTAPNGVAVIEAIGEYFEPVAYSHDAWA